MTVLNTADKIYFGTSLVAKVYAGSNKVWPAAWTPADLGVNLEAWLDASDVSTVTVTGSGVSEWRDKSSYGRHVAQTNDGNRPAYVGGKIRLYGLKSLVPEVAYPPASYDYLLVGKTVGPSNYRSVFITGGGSYVSLLIDPSDLVGIWAYDFQHAGLFWPSETEALLYGTFSGFTYSMAKNGGPLASLNTGMPNVSLSSIGRTDAAQSFGDIYEWILVSFGASTNTKQKLEGYAAWKWNLVSLLPSGHPYKTTPP